MDFHPSKFYVYSHSINGVVKYIGKGSRTRVLEFSKRSAKWKKLFLNKEGFSFEILSWHETSKSALAEECRLIEEIRPEANSLRNPDYKMPKTQRANLSKSHSGKQLSKLDRSNKSIAANDRKKKVRNKDTGEVYNSIKAASLALGVPYANAKRCLQKGFSHTGGHRIEYA